MKRTLCSLLLLCALNFAFAKDYYFSSSSGDDSRTAAQAGSSSTPWKSISKLNSIFSTLVSGDRILFKRGDVFYGSINIKKSGITLTAYGSGAKPVITGFTTLTGWKSLGGGKYESYNASLGSSLSVLNMNNVPQAMGRYPNRSASNKGYLIFESVGTNSITDNQLTSSTNWTGAEVVIRTHHWVLDRLKVTSHSGTKVTYSPAATYTPQKNFGYFFQNDIRTLDQFGEWFYKPSTKKVTLYFGSASPSSYKIEASSIKDLVYLNNYDKITIDGLAFKGSTENLIDIYSSDYTSIKNCDFLSAGHNGIWAQNTSHLLVENCVISYSNSIGIFLYSNTNNSTIRGNKIDNTGIFEGMGQNGPNMNVGIRANGNSNLIEYNTVTKSGFCGIRFTGNNVNIRYNLIDNFAFVKDDAGGIYTGAANQEVEYGRKITNNIIINGIGAKEGTTSTEVQQVSGIYLDNYTCGVDVTGNSIENCGKLGIYVHNAYNIVVRNNTCYNNTGQIMLNHDSRSSVRNVTMRNNIFISKTAKQPVGYFYTKDNDIASFGKIDSNYYARPIDDNLTIIGITGLYTGSTQITTKYTLATWQKKYGFDMHSKKSPKTIPSTANPDSYFKFVYNASKSSKSFPLDGTYIDIKNKSYSSSITLGAYTSAVLLKTSAQSAPVAGATPVVTINLPTANATYNSPADIRINVSATVSGAKITKVEFFKNGSLLHTESASPYDWHWTNVQPGTYTITAKATTDQGISKTSSAVTVYVKSPTGSTVVLDSTTMYGASAASALVLSPNPATSQLRLNFNTNNLPGQGVVSILNASGAIIKKLTVALNSTFMELDVSSLLPGVYILNVTGKNFNTSRSFIKRN
jgi:parallel beta-helix repeat protein